MPLEDEAGKREREEAIENYIMFHNLFIRSVSGMFHSFSDVSFFCRGFLGTRY